MASASPRKRGSSQPVVRAGILSAVRLEELSRICTAQNARRFAAPLMRGGHLACGNLTKNRRNPTSPIADSAHDKF
jgi:hypothetical protein